MNNNKEEYYKNLIHCYLSKKATRDNIDDLRLWINQSAENKKQFQILRRIWILTSQAPPRGKFNKAKYNEWKKLSAKITEKDKSIRIISISPLQKAIRIAAAFLLLVSVGSSFAWIITSQKLQNLLTTETVNQINVPLGGRSEVILPDGSKVNLNAGSKLSYSGNFGLSNRNVLLEGEGYFEVKTNPDKPFIVETSGLDIQALGTKFNIKAYPEEDKIITTLIEGIVRIKGKCIDYTMKPSEKLTYIKQTRQVLPEELKTEYSKNGLEHKKNDDVSTTPVINLTNNINTQEITSWKDDIFIFDSEKLSDLAVILERRYDISIIIESEILKDHKFTGTFHHETLEQLLAIIDLSAPIKYKIEKGIVRLKMDEKRKAIFKELSHN